MNPTSKKIEVKAPNTFRHVATSRDLNYASDAEIADQFFREFDASATAASTKIVPEMNPISTIIHRMVQAVVTRMGSAIAEEKSSSDKAILIHEEDIPLELKKKRSEPPNNTNVPADSDGDDGKRFSVSFSRKEFKQLVDLQHRLKKQTRTDTILYAVDRMDTLTQKLFPNSDDSSAGKTYVWTQDDELYLIPISRGPVQKGSK
jgi:hypothetical protein